MKHTPKGRGGKREGAGRPKTGMPLKASIAKRIPQHRIDEVDALLKGDIIAFPATPARFKPIPYMRAANNPEPFERPLFRARVAAGFPSPADDYVEDELDLNSHLSMMLRPRFF